MNFRGASVAQLSGGVMDDLVLTIGLPNKKLCTRETMRSSSLQ